MADFPTEFDNKQTQVTNGVEKVIAAKVAGEFHDLYGLVLANTSSTNCNVTVKDSLAGTTRFVFAVPANDTRGFMLPKDSAHKQANINTDWTVTLSQTITAMEVTAMWRIRKNP